MTRHTRAAAAALAAALSIACLQPATASGAGPVVRVSAQEVGDGTWRLEANVTDAGGGARSQVEVTFLAAADFFGPRLVPLGSAITDTSGTAVLLYRPSWNGEQQLVARASAPQVVAESEPLVINVHHALSGVPSEAQDLPIVRAWALPVGIAVVVSVWIVLALIFLSAVIGIVGRPQPVITRELPVMPDGMRAVESEIDGGPVA